MALKQVWFGQAELGMLRIARMRPLEWPNEPKSKNWQPEGPNALVLGLGGWRTYFCFSLTRYLIVRQMVPSPI